MYRDMDCRDATRKMSNREAKEFLLDYIDTFRLGSDQKEHRIDSWKLKLSARQYRVLRALVDREGRIVQSAYLLDLLDECGQFEYASRIALSSVIKEIRKRLRASEMDYGHIETLSGLGYRFMPTTDRAAEHHPTSGQKEPQSQ